MSEDINVTDGTILEALNNKVDLDGKNYPDSGLEEIIEQRIGAGLNVGDIFYTSRLDTELNGAVECNGATYDTGDFSGKQSIGELLSGDKLPYVSLEEYANLVSANGSCRAFGWDGGNEFRVPTIPALLLTKEQSAVVGNGMTLGLTNGTSLEGLGFSSDGIVIHRSGNYGADVGSTNSGSGSTNNSAGVTTDPTKSGIVANLDVVEYRAMVQLANKATDEALITATSALQQVANKVDKTSQTDRETVVGWGMPDYSAGVSVSYTTLNSGFEAPNDGIITGSWNPLNSDTLVYVNGKVVGGGNTYVQTLHARLSKGDIVKAASDTSTNTIVFYPLKGVKND